MNQENNNPTDTRPDWLKQIYAETDKRIEESMAISQARFEKEMAISQAD